jgi:hypothetical protein
MKVTSPKITALTMFVVAHIFTHLAIALTLDDFPTLQ